MSARTNDAPPAESKAPTSARDLLKSKGEELERLFAASPAGPIPEGECVGTGIACPGSVWAHGIAWFVRWFAWQGKVFDAASGSLVNRIGFLSVRAIRAQVYAGASWVDGKPCTVLDYSKTSFVARKIRDEIREVAPGLYLGQVWWGKTKLVHFSVSQRFEAPSRTSRRLLTVLALIVLAIAAGLGLRFTSDDPASYADPREHFMYGSTGGERGAGIPLSIWNLLPELFARHLPGPEGYASMGFVFEPDRELPIGVSQRRVQGVERVFVNCAVCHVGTVRMAPDAPRQIVVGMGANTLDLQAFERFLFACVEDEAFTGQRIAIELKARRSEGWLNRLLLRYVGVNLMRERLLLVDQRFRFMDREPDSGPGRVDTFNPPKVLLNFPMDKVPEKEWIGLCDLPSIWNQKQREGMWLHWDGNNNSVAERNRSAAFGTGATPTTLDRQSMKRIEDWLKSAGNKPPGFPGPVDAARAVRGKELYGEYCARCHGRDGSDFTGELVGQVTPIGAVGTDPSRLDSYSEALCANQNLLYAGYPEDRFRHFRKTDGYANQPLDGIWLRAPYLHNGSVPTLRELLEPSSKRRTKFYRGNDLYDAKWMGFEAGLAEESGRRFFLFDTQRKGNWNRGHEGKAYGTELSDDEKDALVEYLKTF